MASRLGGEDAIGVRLVWMTILAGYTVRQDMRHDAEGRVISIARAFEGLRA